MTALGNFDFIIPDLLEAGWCGSASPVDQLPADVLVDGTQTDTALDTVESHTGGCQMHIAVFDSVHQFGVVVEDDESGFYTQ